MALASVSLRTSAHIIPLPSAALAPVINLPHRSGRYTKGITPLLRGKVLRRERLEAERRADKKAQSVADGQRMAQLILSPDLPRPAGDWPFQFISRAEFALLNAGDRKSAELYVAGIVTVRRQDARHV